MSFIKKVFSGILGFLQGLLTGVTKTLGVGKSEYFLELLDDDASSNEVAPSPSPNGSASSAVETPAAAPTPSAPPSAAPPRANSGSSSSKAPSRPSAPEPSLDVITPTADPAQSIQTPAQPRTTKPADSTVLAPSSNSENGSEPKAGTFAPNFLLNRSTLGGRRRPGPSLNPFKAMAKDLGGAS